MLKRENKNQITAKAQVALQKSGRSHLQRSLTANQAITTLKGGKLRTTLPRNPGESHYDAIRRHNAEVHSVFIDSSFNTNINKRIALRAPTAYSSGDLHHSVGAVTGIALKDIADFGYPCRIDLIIGYGLINSKGLRVDDGWNDNNLVTVYNAREVIDYFKRIEIKIFNKIQDYHVNVDSDYKIDKINGIYLDLWNMPSIVGRRYLKDFESLGGGSSNSSAIQIPINYYDDLCLFWAILGGISYIENRKNHLYTKGGAYVTNKVNNKWYKALKKYLGEDYTQHPLYQKVMCGTYDEIELYTQCEEVFGVNLCAYEKYDEPKELPMQRYRNNVEGRHTIHILKMIQRDEKGELHYHYATITNESAFRKLYDNYANGASRFRCLYCNKTFKKKEQIDPANHICNSDAPDPANIKMPKEGSKYQFKSFPALIQREVHCVMSVIDVRGASYEDAYQKELATRKICNMDAVAIAVEFVCTSSNVHLQKLCKEASGIVGFFDGDLDEAQLEEIAELMSHIHIEESDAEEEDGEDEGDFEDDQHISNKLKKTKFTPKPSITNVIKKALDYVGQKSDKIMRMVFDLRYTEIPAMTPQQQYAYDNATHCCLCLGEGDWQERVEKAVTRDVKGDDGKKKKVPTGEMRLVAQKNTKVPHHVHHETEFVGGAAHNHCNLQAQAKREMTIVFHNLTKWGLAFVRKFEVKRHGCHLKYMRESSEKITNIRYRRYYGYKKFYNINIVDHAGFIPHEKEGGISEMARYLIDSVGEDKMVRTKELLEPYNVPRDFWDVLFKDTGLQFENISMLDIKNNIMPSQKYFKSALNVIDTSAEDRARCIKIMDRFGITFYEYYKLMCRLEASLLVDIFQDFRDMSWNEIHLEPLNFLGTPGLADAGWLYGIYKENKMDIELMTSQDMYEDTEADKIGGMAWVPRTYSRANVPQAPWFKAEEAIKSIHYIDFTQQYPTVACEKLPIGDFQEDHKVYEGKKMWKKIDEIVAGINSERGCHIKVKMNLPRHVSEWREHTPAKFCHALPSNPDFDLHDFHSEFPFAPQRRVVDPSEYSATAHRRWMKDYPKKKIPKSERIMQDFYPKESYTLRDDSLLFYIQMGYVIENIHYIKSFKQDYIMRDYMEHCMTQRTLHKNAGNGNLARFWKLMAVAVPGRTMIDTRNFINTGIRTQAQVQRLMNRNRVKGHNIAMEDKDYSAIAYTKTTVTLDRPIFLGVDIYMRSKLIQFKMWTSLKLKFGNRIGLLMTDTDSLLFDFIWKSADVDVYTELKEFEKEMGYEIFDWDQSNRSGLYKFEYHGKVIIEVCIPRSKTNSILFHDMEEEKKASGTPKMVVKHDVKHLDYIASQYFDIKGLNLDLVEGLKYWKKDMEAAGIRLGQDKYVQYAAIHSKEGQNVLGLENRRVIGWFDPKGYRCEDGITNKPLSPYLPRFGMN